MNKIRNFVAVGLSLVILSIYPAVAHAARMTYGVAGGENSFLGSVACGTQGSNYVMQNPTITSGHVSSMYVYDNDTDGDNFIEVGWVKLNGWSSPKFFAAWSSNGNYNQEYLGTASSGNHSYKVELVNGVWYWYVDGTLKNQELVGNYTSGVSMASSERNASGDTNYSHFWGMKFKYNSTWYNWTNLNQCMDNDPDYYLNKINNTECYMQT